MDQLHLLEYLSFNKYKNKKKKLNIQFFIDYEKVGLELK